MKYRLKKDLGEVILDDADIFGFEFTTLFEPIEEGKVKETIFTDGKTLEEWIGDKIDDYRSIYISQRRAAKWFNYDILFEAIYLLKEYAKVVNEGWVPDWNCSEVKYSVYYDAWVYLDTQVNSYNRNYLVYFKDSELAEQSITDMEKYWKIYFGV